MSIRESVSCRAFIIPFANVCVFPVPNGPYSKSNGVIEFKPPLCLIKRTAPSCHRFKASSGPMSCGHLNKEKIINRLLTWTFIYHVV